MLNLRIHGSKKMEKASPFIIRLIHELDQAVCQKLAHHVLQAGDTSELQLYL